MEKWKGSHHDLAMQKATDSTVLGDFDDAVFTYFDETYEFFVRDGAFFVRDRDPSGQPREHEIAYTFGVQPLQQYLLPFAGGRLQALAVAWDTRPAEEGGQRWFHLHPDEEVRAGDPLHWTGLAHTWNYMCAECHSTDLRKGYTAAQNRYETKWAELDVSCEACHGPGSSHVAWAEETTARGTPSSAQEDRSAAEMGLAVDFAAGRSGWVFDESATVARRSMPRQGADVQVEACGRCHSRRSAITSTYEFGRLLTDTHLPALLEEGLYHADGQIDDEVYVYGSFLQSRMYAAGVTCTDCHDAHSLELHADGDALCLRCHRPEAYATADHHFHGERRAGPPTEATGDSALAGPSGVASEEPTPLCVDCHMPSRTYMVVDPRRDHSFRIPRPDMSVAVGSPNACSSCHADRPLEWAVDAVREWYGYQTEEDGANRGGHYGLALAAGRAGSPFGEPQLISLLGDQAQPAIARATAASLLAQYGSAGSLGALSLALSDPDPLVRTAAVGSLERLQPERRIAPAAPLLADSVRAVRLEAARVLASVPRAALTPEQGASLEAAIAEYVDAQSVNSDHPTSHVNLALLEAGRGNLAAAERELLTAVEIGPYFVPAYVNLADLYRAQGREADVVRLLDGAIAVLPDEPALYHVLGLSYARQQLGEEALEALARAARLAPEDRRFAFVYGVALNSAGRSTEAIAVLARALESAPWDRDLLIGLATFHRDRGEVSDALEYARRLAEAWPDDPGGRQLVGELESARD